MNKKLKLFGLICLVIVIMFFGFLNLELFTQKSEKLIVQDEPSKDAVKDRQQTQNSKLLKNDFGLKEISDDLAFVIGLEGKGKDLKARLDLVLRHLKRDQLTKHELKTLINFLSELKPESANQLAYHSLKNEIMSNKFEYFR